MAPNINNPGGVKNDPDEIRDGVVSDSTRFPGGFIDEQITAAGAAVQIVGQFEVSNASFVQSFDVSGQETFPSGLAFNPNGDKLYVVGTSSVSVHQYSLSTAFDVSTASFVRSFDVSPQDTSPTGIVFKPNGEQLYVIGSGNDNVYQYSLSTGFDISTASFARSFDVSGQLVLPQGLAFKPDGSRLYAVGSSSNSVEQYSLSTAYDISTATSSQSFDVSSQDASPRSVVFKPDGSRLYLLGEGNDNVYQYSLSTGFDISTASFARSFDVSGQETLSTGLAFKPDGEQLYVIGNDATDVHQYAVGFVGAELG